jgi:hypothetical protein
MLFLILHSWTRIMRCCSLANLYARSKSTVSYPFSSSSCFFSFVVQNPASRYLSTTMLLLSQLYSLTFSLLFGFRDRHKKISLVMLSNARMVIRRRRVISHRVCDEGSTSGVARFVPLGPRNKSTTFWCHFWAAHQWKDRLEHLGFLVRREWSDIYSCM